MIYIFLVLLAIQLVVSVREVSVLDTGVYVPTSMGECLDARQMGASPELNDNQLVIQAALDYASLTQEYKCVSISDGVFKSSDISLRSNVVFWVNEDAVLSTVPGSTLVALIHGVNVSHVGLMGGGVLHGSAEDYVQFYDSGYERYEPRSDIPRPNIILFDSVDGAFFTNIRLQNSSNWNCRLRGSSNLRIDSISVFGDNRFPNNDGIDPESSVNVTILNSHIDVADDGVCPKATKGYGPLSNLLVRNCRIRSKSHAIKFGSNTDTPMFDILFDQIEIYDSNAGLSIQMRSPGPIYDVTWSNIKIETRRYAPRWWGNGEPIWITNSVRSVDLPTGRIYGLKFINITAVSENGGLISGRNGARITDVYMENVEIILSRWSNYSFPGSANCLDADSGLPIDCRGSIDRRPALHEWKGTSFNLRWKSKTPILTVENAELELNGFTGSFHGAMQEYWADECLSLDNSDVTVDNVDGYTCNLAQ